MRLLLITRYICFIQILLRENDARARVEIFFSIIVGTAVGAATAAVRVLEGQYIQEHRNPLRDSGQPMGPLGPSGTRSCLLYTSPSPRDLSTSRMPSSA